jgi:serine/threonine protein kinase
MCVRLILTWRRLLTIIGGPSKKPHFYSRLTSQLFSALAYLQVKKLVHCDIKPANILQNNNGMNFYLADFGLSNYLDEARSNRGTRNYMSPEAFKHGKLTHAADIWSFGIVLFEVTYDLPLIAGSNFKSSVWHERIIRLATSKRPDLLSMLDLNPEARPDANTCLRNLKGPKDPVPIKRERVPTDPNLASVSQKSHKRSNRTIKRETSIDDPATQTQVPFSLSINSQKEARKAPSSVKHEHGGPRPSLHCREATVKVEASTLNSCNHSASRELCQKKNSQTQERRTRSKPPGGPPTSTRSKSPKPATSSHNDSETTRVVPQARPGLPPSSVKSKLPKPGTPIRPETGSIRRHRKTSGSDSDTQKAQKRSKILPGARPKTQLGTDAKTL